MIAKVKKYLSDVKTELKNVSWPDRHEMIGATGVVILSTVLLALFIGTVDFVLSTAINFILKL